MLMNLKPKEAFLIRLNGPPPFDVEDDLPGVFPLAFLIPDVSSTRRLLSLSGRFLAMENKLVLNVTNKERIDRAARTRLSNRRER